MTEYFSFARSELSFHHAASAGVSAAAGVLAGALRAEGKLAVVEPKLDGTVAVTLEGAAPAIAPVLEASRPRMIEAIVHELGQAISDARS